MENCVKRKLGRLRRKRSIRKKISGTAERPRLSVFRSSRHIYVQLIDDVQGKTLASASTVEAATRGAMGELNGVDAARAVGEAIAKRAIEAGYAKAVFDRNGYIYHGRVKALADGAREGGLDF